MRSSELARRAGVSVRALRHYHQIGVLDEPARSGNGYRDYDVDDLIRVLRIRRMASVGVPLEEMPALLDDETDGSELLEALDQELSAQMDRLARQRATIARLRDSRTPPDLPPEVGRFLAAFRAATVPSTDRERTDRDQSVLLAYLVGEEGMPDLTRFYERLGDPLLVPTIDSFSDHFDRLDDDTPDQDVDALVEDLVATLAPLVEDLATSEPLASASADLLTEYTGSRLNQRQRATIARIEARLDQRREG